LSTGLAIEYPLIDLHGEECFLKIARFRHELNALRRETKVYGALKAHSLALAPEVLGFVYEETNDRVIGFIMEVLYGRHPNSADLEICQKVMGQLHAIGIVHGDLNKYNIIISAKEAKLIDFKTATFQDEKNYLIMKREDVTTLAQKLTDSSGVGDRGI
jgi:tRNA A-37 threonylcarbamoyl transferase component Bud32